MHPGQKASGGANRDLARFLLGLDSLPDAT